jgi:hypothetical protein
MLKRDIEAIWGANPQTVFRIVPNNIGLRRDWKPTYIQIVKKMGSGYIVEYLTYRRGEHRWDTHIGDSPISCKRIERIHYYQEHTLKSLKELLTAEAQANWQEEQIRLQIKPNAIAEILSLTELDERDLKQTPEEVLIVLAEALKK